MIYNYEVAPRNALNDFLNLIKDNNPIHRDVSFAKTKGFTDTPLPAVYLQALSESCTKNNNAVQLMPADVIYSGHSFRFAKPIFPCDKLTLNTRDLFINEGNCTYNLSGMKNGVEEVFSSDTRFSKQLAPFEETKGKIVYSSDNEIRMHHNDLFYLLTLREPSEKISWMFVASNIPAALLEGAREKTGSYDGLTLKVDLKFHNEPKLGNIHTDIHLLRDPRGSVEKGFMYLFRGICYQEGKPILSGDLTVVHPKNLVE